MTTKIDDTNKPTTAMHSQGTQSTGRAVSRSLVLLGAPLAFAILEFFHPKQPGGVSEAVEQGCGSCGSTSSRFPSSVS
jgi:hypothetical protein